MFESKADYSRRKGWSRGSVTRAAQEGRLVLTADGLVDVEASEQRLQELADPTKEGVRQRHAATREARAGEGAGGNGSKADGGSSYRVLTQHRAEAEGHRAELLRIELDERAGRLVDAETVRKQAFQLARAGREAVMNLRHRIDPLLAGEADAAKRAEIWDRELRLICDEMSRGCMEVLEGDHHYRAD